MSGWTPGLWTLAALIVEISLLLLKTMSRAHGKILNVLLNLWTLLLALVRMLCLTIKKPQAPGASEQSIVIESSDSEQEADSEVRCMIQSNHGQLPAKYSNYILWCFLLLLCFVTSYILFLCFWCQEEHLTKCRHVQFILPAVGGAVLCCVGGAVLLAAVHGEWGMRGTLFFWSLHWCYQESCCPIRHCNTSPRPSLVRVVLINSAIPQHLVRICEVDRVRTGFPLVRDGSPSTRERVLMRRGRSGIPLLAPLF